MFFFWLLVSGELACKTHKVKFFSLRNITHRKKKNIYIYIYDIQFARQGEKKFKEREEKKIVCSKDLAPSKKNVCTFLLTIYS